MKVNIPKQDEIIRHYGTEAQLGIHMEECAELIQAISKGRRAIESSNDGCISPYVKDDIVEEMADVLICMEQLKDIFMITDKMIEEVVLRKYERQKMRIEREGK